MPAIAQYDKSRHGRMLCRRLDAAAILGVHDIGLMRHALRRRQPVMKPRDGHIR